MMRLGKIETSLIDWEGHVSAVMFFAGCNFRCGYCHNSKLIPTWSGTKYTHEEVFAMIEERTDVIDSIVFCGGEPTMQSFQLWGECMPIANELDLRSKLDTNGTNTHAVTQCIREGLDKVSLDIKARPIKKDYEFIIGRCTNNVDYLLSIIRTMKVLKRYKIELEVRTTIVPGVNDYPGDIKEIAEWVEPYADEYTLQRYDPTNVYHPLMKNIMPPTMEDLEELAEVARDIIPKVNIRPSPL